MCNKWGADLIGTKVKEEKGVQPCCFSEILSDLSVEEEVTKYGHIRIKNISFVEVFKNLWKNF